MARGGAGGMIGDSSNRATIVTMIALSGCLAACVGEFAITPGMLQRPSSTPTYLCKDHLNRTAIFTKKCPDGYKLVEKRT